jgi:hypothetical protein
MADTRMDDEPEKEDDRRKCADTVESLPMRAGVN